VVGGGNTKAEVIVNNKTILKIRRIIYQVFYFLTKNADGNEKFIFH